MGVTVSKQVCVGERYGDLEVLRFLGNKLNHKKYLCKCHKCGEQLEVQRETVLNAVKVGGCKLCRESRFNKRSENGMNAISTDLTDSVIGSYHVVAPASTDRNYKNAKLWLATCQKCGREHILTTTMLYSKIPCVCESKKTKEAKPAASTQASKKPISAKKPTAVKQSDSDYPGADIDKLLMSFRHDMQAKDDRIRQLREEKANISQMCESFKNIFSFV
ncbi:MAG: hypothetical protein Q4G33_12460 [bacterium]|nr:hypothetical protein [bacterium]